MLRSILTLLIPSSTWMHWKIPKAVSVIVGCNKNNIVIVDTTMFLLKSVNHLGKIKWKMPNTIKNNTNNIIGRIDNKNAFINAVDGVKSVILVFLANQSKDNNVCELVPSFCIGTKSWRSASGNFIPYDRVAVIICK